LVFATSILQGRFMSYIEMRRNCCCVLTENILILSMAVIVSLCSLAQNAAAQSATKSPVIRPKVIVVVYFEVGKDTGDTPGELQFWVERDHLDRVIEVPGMSRAVRANADGSEVAMAVGPGNIRPGVNLMAFGLNPQFDLRKSYWLINGIAGVSPREMSLASAVWTDYVVNGDLAHEIDPREMPQDWPDGFYALDQSKPDEQPRVPAGSAEDVRTWPKQGAHSDSSGSVVRMNPALLAWAYGLTRDMKLPETEQMRSLEARYQGFPAAQEPPTVKVGANLAGETFWHGAKMDEWAHRWVRYMTDGQASFGSTAMNDSGSMVALAALTRAGRADWNRALVLRTGSNFDMQAPDETAEQSANRERHGGYTAYEPSLESAYLVGSRVVKALIGGWRKYEANLPSGVSLPPV
jgi:purine nucleoside permease